MKCPICSTIDLVLSERHGIDIDYCPKCRGVWLDRGELDKISERSYTQSSAPIPFPSAGHQHENRTKDDHDHHDREHDYKYGRHSRHRSWLGDLFD